MARTRTFEDYVGAYGQNWTTGILSDHVISAQAHLGRAATVDAEGNTFLGDYPVLCSEIVEVYTEDGTIHGRCGTPVLFNAYACPGHYEVIEAWRGASEAERIEWEMEDDREF